MENNADTLNERKLGKTRSSMSTAPVRVKSEAAKRKSFNVNEAVRSLDLTLGRLKKSKLVNGECTPKQMGPTQGAMDIFMDTTNSDYLVAVDNSVMSLNFSHYELIRNLSRSHCNSEGNFSGNSVRLSPADVLVRNEHLEKYFRSIETCSRRYMDGSHSAINIDVPEQ